MLAGVLELYPVPQGATIRQPGAEARGLPQLGADRTPNRRILPLAFCEQGWRWRSGRRVRHEAGCGDIPSGAGEAQGDRWVHCERYETAAR